MARGDRFPGTRPTMPAVDLHGRDGFALLARAFVELGAIRNTSRLCQRSAPAMWHPPWHRGGAGGGPGEFGVVAPRPRRDRVIDRRARQRSLGYQLNTGPPGGLGRGNGDVAGDGWPAGRRDGARGRGSATRGLPADGVICRYGGTSGERANARPLRRRWRNIGRRPLPTSTRTSWLARRKGPSNHGSAPGWTCARRGPSSPGPFPWRRSAVSRRRSVAAATALPRTILTRGWHTRSGSGSRRWTRSSRRRCGVTRGRS